MSAPVTAVAAEELVCPGCARPAVGEPPSSWPAAAGAAPEFSHPDGSVLCPDGRGRIGEPVEAALLAVVPGPGEWS